MKTTVEEPTRVRSNNCEYFDFKTDVDYYIFTDGSGYTDGIGGNCAIVYNVATKETNTLISSNTKTTVPREEFKGILNGLAFINGNDPRMGLQIRWYSDAQSLVLSARLEQGRKSNKDLWCQFEYYESKFEIEPIHVLRTNDIPYMSIADLHASSMRELMKEYIQMI